MRSYALQLVVAAAMTSFVGHVDGRAAYTDYQVEDWQECPHKAIPNTMGTVPFVMLMEVHKCYTPSATFEGEIVSATDYNAFRRIFQSACDQEPAVRGCIATVAADASVCLNRAERQLWDAVLDFLDRCIKATCGDGGERMAGIFGDELEPMTAANRMRTVCCLCATTAQTTFNLSAYNWRKYRNFKDAKKCVVNVAKRGHTSSIQFEQFVDELLESMKCVSPVTYDIVPCSSLETAQQNMAESVADEVHN